eukprot:3718813-Ditylum_brightwellii.AAC.1
MDSISSVSAPNTSRGASSSMLQRLLSKNLREPGNVEAGTEVQQPNPPKSPTKGDNRMCPPTPPRPFSRTNASAN